MVKTTPKPRATKNSRGELVGPPPPPPSDPPSVEVADAAELVVVVADIASDRCQSEPVGLQRRNCRYSAKSSAKSSDDVVDCKGCGSASKHRPNPQVRAVYNVVQLQKRDTVNVARVI